MSGDATSDDRGGESVAPSEDVMRLLHDVDGLLGLAKHRGEHRLADPHHKAWEKDAWDVLERVQRYTRAR